MPPTVTKNRQANEFRAKAQALRDELADETKSFTREEVDAKLDEIKAFESRAAIAAEFTADAEIVRQGGEELVRKPGPNGNGDGAADESTYDEIVQDIRKAFGGPNGYLLAMARRRDTPMSARQLEAHARAQAFHKRVIIGDESDASGGEWLLPLQQEESIFVADLTQPGLLERARRFAVSGRTLRIPMLDQSNDANTRPMASIAAITIVGEGAEKPIREPKFLQRLLTVYKWAAYSEIGDEVLADDMTGSLAPTLQRAVGGQVMNEINGFVTFDGDGTGEPLAALHANNPALYTVARETTSTVTVNDIFEMDARHVEGPGSFWIAHPSVKPKLFGMQLAASSMVTWISNLRDRPVPMLLGKPIVFTHLGPPLSGVGDLALINPEFYAVAMRQALTVESSIHYKFRNDITAYRFFARAGGIPIPLGFYSYKATVGNKDYPVSPFVALSDAIDS
jgi:HK97 family phage major capsid protein